MNRMAVVTILPAIDRPSPLAQLWPDGVLVFV